MAINPVEETTAVEEVKGMEVLEHESNPVEEVKEVVDELVPQVKVQLQVISGSVKCDAMWVAKKLTFGQMLLWLRSIELGSNVKFETLDDDILSDITDVQEIASTTNGQIKFDVLMGELANRIQADKFAGKTDVEHTVASLRIKDLPYNAE